MLQQKDFVIKKQGYCPAFALFKTSTAPRGYCSSHFNEIGTSPVISISIKLEINNTASTAKVRRITKDIYDKKHQEYQNRIQLLEIELSEHQKADYDYQTTVATVLSVARRARTIFENSSDVAKKDVLE